MPPETDLLSPLGAPRVEADVHPGVDAEEIGHLREVEISLSRLNGALMSLARRNRERGKQMDQLLALMRLTSAQARALAEGCAPSRPGPQPPPQHLPRWLTPTRLRRIPFMLAGLSAAASLLVILLGI